MTKTEIDSIVDATFPRYELPLHNATEIVNIVLNAIEEGDLGGVNGTSVTDVIDEIDYAHLNKTEADTEDIVRFIAKQAGYTF